MGSHTHLGVVHCNEVTLQLHNVALHILNVGSNGVQVLIDAS